MIRTYQIPFSHSALFFHPQVYFYGIADIQLFHASPLIETWRARVRILLPASPAQMYDTLRIAAKAVRDVDLDDTKDNLAKVPSLFSVFACRQKPEYLLRKSYLLYDIFRILSSQVFLLTHNQLKNG